MELKLPRWTVTRVEPERDKCFGFFEEMRQRHQYEDDLSEALGVLPPPTQIGQEGEAEQQPGAGKGQEKWARRWFSCTLVVVTGTAL